MNSELKRKQLSAAVHAAREAVERVASLSESADDAETGAAELLFNERRRRDECFPAGAFREPAWDIMLTLFVARDQGRELRQVDVFRIANVPGTTGLRVLDHFEDIGLIRRRAGEECKGRRFVSLTDDAIARMRKFLSQS